MSYLFVDTSHLLHIGLLNENFDWVDSEVLEIKKTSEILHDRIKSLLDRHSIDISNLSALITIAGPGSYTGMRVGEGLAQVFELDGIPTYSFYSSNIPSILGIEGYSWCFPAFKSEYYIRTSEGDRLVSRSEFHDFSSLNKGNMITHGVNEVTEYCSRDTRTMLESNPKEIFSHVIKENLRVSPYYFRALDVEFKKS